MVGKIRLISYGIKYGPLLGEDLETIEYDATKLPNPHNDSDLRPLNGLDTKVQKYVMMGDRAENMLKGAELNLLKANGGTAAFRCIGGKHRSVTMVEKLAERLAIKGLTVQVVHRGA